MNVVKKNKDNVRVSDFDGELVVALNISTSLFSFSTLIKLSKRARRSTEDVVQILEKEGSLIIFFRVLNMGLTQVDVKNFFLKSLKAVLSEMKKTLLQFSDYLPEPFTKSEMYEIYRYESEIHEIECDYFDPSPYLIATTENLSKENELLKLTTSFYERTTATQTVATISQPLFTVQHPYKTQ